MYTVLYRCSYGPEAKEAGLKRVGGGMCPDRGGGGVHVLIKKFNANQQGIALKGKVE
jgi:hypothetical protein